MKLNPDCIRDILIFCEDYLTLDSNLQLQIAELEDICEALPDYPREEIAYTIKKLDEAGYINAIIQFASGRIIYRLTVVELTYEGHEFIDTIRPENVWDKVSKVISNVSSISLPVLQQIGSQALLSFLSF